MLAVLNSPDLVEEISKFFYDSTQKLIASESYTLVGGKISGVDLVRQVLRVVPIHWVAVDLVSLICSIIFFFSAFVLMGLFRQAFSSKPKTILMVLIQQLNFLIYWVISIRKLKPTFRSNIDMY